MPCKIDNKKDSPSVSLGLLVSLLLSDASMSASLAGDERTALRVILFTSSRTGSTDRLSLFLTDPVSSTSRYVITSFFSLTFWSKDLETNAVSSSITAPKKKKKHNLPFRSSAVYHKTSAVFSFYRPKCEMMWWDLWQFLLLRSVQTCCRFTIEVTLFILSEASAPWSARITFPHHEPPSHRGGLGWGGGEPYLSFRSTSPFHACYWLRLTRGAN